LVGVNELVIPPEEEEPIPIHEVPRETGELTIRRLREFKASRNTENTKESLYRLYENAKKGEKFNLMPSTIEAVRNNATIGEIWGTIRIANGLSYDPFNVIGSPFKYM
jgi:methylmalonyl-CoA mutase N-terminal domain/subunit